MFSLFFSAWRFTSPEIILQLIALLCLAIAAVLCKSKQIEIKIIKCKLQEN